MATLRAGAVRRHDGDGRRARRDQRAAARPAPSAAPRARAGGGGESLRLLPERAGGDRRGRGADRRGRGVRRSEPARRTVDGRVRRRGRRPLALATPVVRAHGVQRRQPHGRDARRVGPLHACARAGLFGDRCRRDRRTRRVARIRVSGGGRRHSAGAVAHACPVVRRASDGAAHGAPHRAARPRRRHCGMARGRGGSCTRGACRGSPRVRGCSPRRLAGSRCSRWSSGNTWASSQDWPPRRSSSAWKRGSAGAPRSRVRRALCSSRDCSSPRRARWSSPRWSRR